MTFVTIVGVIRSYFIEAYYVNYFHIKDVFSPLGILNFNEPYGKWFVIQ